MVLYEDLLAVQPDSVPAESESEHQLPSPTEIFDIVSSTAARLLPPETAQASSSRAELRHVLISRIEEALAGIDEIKPLIGKSEHENVIEMAVMDATEETPISIPIVLVSVKEWQALLTHCVSSLVFLLLYDAQAFQ